MLFTRGIVLVFIGKAKQVPLVVTLNAPSGRMTDEAIKVVRAVADDQAAANCVSRSAGGRREASHRRAVHAFGLAFGVHRKAGAEHLREDDQVGGSINASMLSREHLPVGVGDRASAGPPVRSRRSELT